MSSRNHQGTELPRPHGRRVTFLGNTMDPFPEAERGFVHDTCRHDVPLLSHWRVFLQSTTAGNRGKQAEVTRMGDLGPTAIHT